MKQTYLLLKLLIASGVLVGCGTVGKVDKGVFRNSTLSNLNPAPESLSPPDISPEKTIVDPTYLQSQSDYHFTLGEALSLEGNKAGAVEEFKMTLVYDAKSVEVRIRLAQEYIRMGLLSESIEQAEAVVHLDPGNVDGHMLLGSLYSSLKMYDQALSQYQIIMEVDSNHQKAQVLIGAVLAEQKKYDEAEKYFDKVAANPENKKPYLAYYYKGKIREERGPDYFAFAEKAYVKSISMKPGQEKPLMALAHLYGKMGREDEAIEMVSSFQDKFGVTRQTAQFLSRVYLEAEKYDLAFKQLEHLEGFEGDNLNIKVKMALILIERKHFNQAVDKLEEILNLAPDSDKIRFYLGAVYEETKQTDFAIKHFQMIPANSNYYSEAVIHSAYLYKSQGKFEEARKVVTDGIKNRNNIPEFYAFYASLLDEMKQYKTAVNMLGKAIERFPSHTQLRFFLGSMYDRLGNKKKTIAAMKAVVDLDGDHIQALNFLAYTYAELSQNLDEAESLAKKALTLNPKDGYILDTVGWVLFKKGKTQEAIKYLEAAFKTKKEESIVAEHLGDAYYRFELVEKAKKMYIHAAGLETNLEKLAKLREKIVAITKQKNAKRSRTPASFGENRSNNP